MECPVNLFKRHFFTTIEKQKKIRSVTKFNDNLHFVKIAIFGQKKGTIRCPFFVCITRGFEPSVSKTISAKRIK